MARIDYEIIDRLRRFIDGIEDPPCAQPDTTFCLDYNETVYLLNQLVKLTFEKNKNKELLCEFERACNYIHSHCAQEMWAQPMFETLAKYKKN